MSNARFDPGGLTKFGIAQNKHPEVDVRNLTEEQALEIYYNEYYRASCADRVPFLFGLLIFECAVNQGLGRAVRLWQQAVGVVADGQAGPVSLAALEKRKNNPDTIAFFMAFRVQAYVGIKDSNPASYAANNKGWFKRMFLATMAGAHG